MLILVGVTVATAINGGLFESARKAAIGTTIEKEKEELTVAIASAYNPETGKIDINKLKSELKGWKFKEKSEECIATSPKDNEFVITKDGTITNENKTEEGTKTLAEVCCDIEGCTNKAHIHKGDYVEYKPTPVAQPYAPDEGKGKGTYTGYTKGDSEQSISQENLNWRVLGKEGDHILLISGSPTNTGLGFEGYVGYNNYETVLNDTCEVLYSNTELRAKARSITMEDIDKYLNGSNYNKKTFSGGSSESGGYGYQNENAISSKFKYDKKTNILTKEDCTISAKDLTSNVYYYIATSDLIGAKNREILLGKEENTYYNWVASRGISVGSAGVAWCLADVEGGYVEANRYFCFSYRPADGCKLSCLRPVVSIPSSVTADQVKKKDGQVTESWNDPLGIYSGN